MRFSNGFLDEIRDRVPISAVIGARVTWDRKKTNVSRGDYWACCPFHGEKSPSFHCEDRKGRYHCFGCGVSGDHFRFLTDLDGMNFPEAVQQVADMAGIPMPAPDKQAEQREKERTSLLDVMEMATAFFQDQLNTASGARGRAYLRDRGLSGRTIETFKLGYAPDSRNALKEFLAGRNVPKDQIEACGLVVHGPEIPVSYDRFRDRIMFPILSSRERTIAFGGRAMSADAPAKYLNSNETELFHKGNVLFNFARARRAGQAVSRGRDEGASVIAVEGYMDVIALHQAGIENAVAPLGTALTENQLDLLWKMSPMPVLCFDGDGAGVRAAHRALDLALPHIRPGRSVRFALLPEGKDPDDLVRHDGRAPFDEVMAQARPLADMLWTRETMGGNFDTPEKRAELESRLRQIVAQIKDEDVRRHYSQAMRERLNTFFRPAPTAARGGFSRNERPQRGGGQAGRGQMAGGGPATASDRLMRSGMVMGHRDQPTLRESVMALSVVNHPELLSRDYDEIAAIDYDNRDLQRLWSAVLGITASAGARLTREAMQEGLEAQGFAPLLASLELQARGAGLWTAMPQAAHEDVADAFGQALALHKRSKALRREKIEIERDIAEAAEAEDGGRIDALMRALQEIQFEILRMENQEAIIDGFGVMSGRIKGAAGR